MTANMDVIELDSSDDDAEPAPKKAKTVPNVMVHIPRKLPGVTIKPAKHKSSPVLEKLAAKPITITKVIKSNVNPYANSNKNILRPEPKKLIIPMKACNPTLNVPRLKPNNIQSVNKFPVNRLIKQPIKIQNSKTISNLPPNITVKRTSSNIIKPNISKAPNIITTKLKKVIPKKIITEVPTVELDDDDDCSPSTTISPQWYLRPEEQIAKPNLEQENNSEPSKSKIIEITIEDSPVKMIHDKRTFEVGAELAITIEDSPIKPLAERNPSDSGSDDEQTVNGKSRNSKKKLEYPKGDIPQAKTIEIELEPIVLDIQKKDTGEQNKEEIEVSFHNDFVEIQANSSNKTTLPMEASKKSKTDTTIGMDPLEIVETKEMSSNKTTLPTEASKKSKSDNTIELDPLDVVETKEKSSKKTTLPIEASKNCYTEATIELDASEVVEIKDKEGNEFHPVYQSFIDLCFKLEDSTDMKKIVEKKIKAYYIQVPKEYTESEAFIDMVSSKIISMKAGPEKMYLYIKDIVDELNLQRKLAKSQSASQAAANTASKEESNKFLYGEDSEFDSKRQRQIRKLEKTLKKLHRAIQLLEEQEVDFDDEDDSVYLLTERYKERMVRVHAKFCQLTNTKMPSEPRVQIDSRPSQPDGPAKRLEKWINQKVPIGTPLPFPDFHDVLRCVREANEEDKLGWNEVDIMEEARDLFTRCGKKLQRRRQENEWRLAASRITLDEDPAETSPDLKKKLELNKHVAAKRETEVFNKYVDRQNLLKLEAEEIGDKEAEESPVESEEEENNDEVTSLLNKEKRKERLKRLLQEKSKKSTVKMENPKSEGNTKETVEEIVIKQNEGDDSKETTSENKENKVDNEATDDKHIESSQDKIHSLSDDSKDIDSDIDELHLLEKLHSEKEMHTSTLESSDSETPIAISDTLSSGDNIKQASDVISIENSSYSESEACAAVDEEVEKVETNVIEIANNSNTPVEAEKNIQKTNNNEYNESVEDILLASSDEENTVKGKSMEDVTCINLENDLISSDDSVVPNKQTPIEDDNLEKDSISSKHTVTNENQPSNKDDCDSAKDSIHIRKNVLESEKPLLKDDINLEIDTISTANECEQPHTKVSSNLVNDSKSIGCTVISSEQPHNEDGTNLKNKSIFTHDTVVESKQASKDISIDLNKDSNSIEDTMFEHQQVVIKDRFDVEKESVPNKKSVADNEKVLIEQEYDFKPIKDSSIIIEKHTDKTNEDIDMTDMSNNVVEQLSPVEEMKTDEQETCCNKSSIQTDINDIIETINTEVIDKSSETERRVDTASMESLSSNMEVDKVTSNTSPDIIV
ncbi:hypothetical protein K1T71_003135 [Dendrolimus kikuchii]|uniref:Uncharacterized protein n=1 Tax=Dendrolimus kikuchii TaxID=765133 RepID=A0ACC1DB14_9NEOP|nr:hypothetical protein K1T71_003135 [Dendrolimus kikuchii]